MCRLGEDSDYFLPDPPEKEVEDDSIIEAHESEIEGYNLKHQDDEWKG